MHERPNNFEEYRAHKESDAKGEADFSYTNSSYETLLKKYNEKRGVIEGIVSDEYRDREFNLKVNEGLEGTKSELEQSEDKLKVAQAIAHLNQLAHLPEDPELSEYIRTESEYCAHLRSWAENTRMTIEGNESISNKRSQNPFVMERIQEDAIAEDRERSGQVDGEANQENLDQEQA